MGWFLALAYLGLEGAADAEEVGDKCTHFMDSRLIQTEVPSARDLGKAFGYLKNYYRDEQALKNDVLFDLSLEQVDQLIAEVEACNQGRTIPEARRPSLLENLLSGPSEAPRDRRLSFPNGWLSAPLGDLRDYRSQIAQRDTGTTEIENAEATIHNFAKTLEQMYSELDKDALPSNAWADAKVEFDKVTKEFANIQSKDIPELKTKYSALVEKRVLSFEGLQSAEYHYNSARDRLLALNHRAADKQSAAMKLKEMEATGTSYFEKSALSRKYPTAPSSFWACKIFVLKQPERDYQRPYYKQWLSTKAIFGIVGPDSALRLEVVNDFDAQLIGIGVKQAGAPEEVFVFSQEDGECYLAGYGSRSQAQWLNNADEQLIAQIRFVSHVENAWSAHHPE